MSSTPELSEAKRALLEKYLRGDLPLPATPTPATTAPETPSEAVAPVVAVQKTGTRKPFFFLHGQWDGQSFYCYTLAQKLGPDQPFYALDPYPLTEQQTLPTLEEVAATHLQALRAIQPAGPYLLGGWCNGALIAYEMARQLQAAGQQVDLLVMMDSNALIYPARYRNYYRIVRFWGNFLHIDQEKQLNSYLYIKHIFHVIISFIRYKLIIRKPDPKPLTFQGLRQDYARLSDWVAMGYKPTSLYRGKIVFFWAEDSHEVPECRPGWSEVEKQDETEVLFVPGNHATALTNYLDVLAGHLRRYVFQAQGLDEGN